MSSFDLVIRNGSIVDGTGAAPFKADIGVQNGRIAAIGSGLAAGTEEIDATGQIVTPGFVDIHTHYDGQVTWEDRLTPSSFHGVTTAVIGNCGVGFAPCREADRDVHDDAADPVCACHQCARRAGCGAEECDAGQRDHASGFPDRLTLGP
jgi:N-acyl-D-aspartate/D-glutamate deacylase